MIIYAVTIFLILNIVSLGLIFLHNYTNSINGKLKAKQNYLNIENKTKDPSTVAYFAYVVFLFLLSMLLSVAISPKDLSIRDARSATELSEVVSNNIGQLDITLHEGIKTTLHSICEQKDLSVEFNDKLYYVSDNTIFKIDLITNQKALIFTEMDGYVIYEFCFISDNFIIASENESEESKIYIYNTSFLTIEKFYIPFSIKKFLLKDNELLIIGEKGLDDYQNGEVIIKDKNNNLYSAAVSDMSYLNNSLLSKNLIIFKVDLTNYNYQIKTVLIYDYLFEIKNDQIYFYAINVNLRNNSPRYSTMLIRFNQKDFSKSKLLVISGLAYDIKALENGDFKVYTVAEKNGKNIIKKFNVSTKVKLKEIEDFEVEKDQVLLERFEKAFLLDLNSNKIISIGKMKDGKFLPDDAILSTSFSTFLISDSLIEIFELEYHYLARKRNLETNQEISFSVEKNGVLDYIIRIDGLFNGGLVFNKTENLIKVITFKNTFETVLTFEGSSCETIFTKNYILLVSDSIMVYNYLGELTIIIE